jgi:ABC-type transport system involved in multi-copper enzyme maturation permease subunit
MGRWAELPGRLLGPIFVLDAARAGRRLSTFVVRWAYLFGLLLVLGMFFLSWSRDFNPQGGRVHPNVLARFAEEFFWVYAVTQFLIIAALTPALTAAAITDEKERKTLDFLLVTALSAREIVFGKLAARVAVLFTLILAGLPVLALLQFVGGIEPRLPLLAAGVTLATVVSASALSVACSVVLPRTREAVVLAYAVPAAYLIASFAWFDAAVAVNRQGRDWSVTVTGHTVTELDAAEAFAAGNAFVMAERWDPTSQGPGAGAGDAVSVTMKYVGFHAVVALAGFGFAALRLRAVGRGAGGGAAPRGKVRRLIAWAQGKRTTARPHPPVTDDPVAWREVHVEPGSGGGLLRRLLALGVLAAVILPFLGIVADTLLSLSPYPYWRRYRTPFEEFQMRTKAWVVAVTVGLGCLMLLRAAVRGAASVAGEKDRDTWTGLLATPLTAREILWGKWCGCVLGQKDAFYLLGGVWAVGVITVAVNPVMVALAAVALGVYLRAFAWLGIACSVTARSTRVAIARAVPAALFAGGGFWLIPGCCGMLSMVGGGPGGRDELLTYAATFLLGFTPPVVLGGLPAMEFSYLHDIGPYAGSHVVALGCGGVFGTGAWVLIGTGFHNHALMVLAQTTGRSVAETLFGHDPPRRPPPTPPLMGRIPPPPPEGPPDSSGTVGPS